MPKCAKDDTMIEVIQYTWREGRQEGLRMTWEGGRVRYGGESWHHLPSPSSSARGRGKGGGKGVRERGEERRGGQQAAAAQCQQHGKGRHNGVSAPEETTHGCRQAGRHGNASSSHPVKSPHLPVPDPVPVLSLSPLRLHALHGRFVSVVMVCVVGRQVGKVVGRVGSGRQVVVVGR